MVRILAEVLSLTSHHSTPRLYGVGDAMKEIHVASSGLLPHDTSVPTGPSEAAKAPRDVHGIHGFARVDALLSGRSSTPGR
jgi:hypothetical protein